VNNAVRSRVSDSRIRASKIKDTAPLLQETVREAKSPRPLFRKQELSYASRLRGHKFSKP
jgi:hypothetical protein